MGNTLLSDKNMLALSFIRKSLVEAQRAERPATDEGKRALLIQRGFVKPSKSRQIIVPLTEAEEGE